MGVDYTQLVPVLIEAVKELKKENNEQRSWIEQLKTENLALNSSLSALESKG